VNTQAVLCYGSMISRFQFLILLGIPLSYERVRLSTAIPPGTVKKRPHFFPGRDKAYLISIAYTTTVRDFRFYP
ncbi:MAG: hypothetical protein L3J12_03565, partial [Spirochaetales bacterium]|nr:hypothetical protein [Spirochaetales bacterium]